jgi:hypothetical protein
MKQQGLSHGFPTAAFIVVLTFCLMVAAPAWSQSMSTDRQQGTPAGVGMQVASVGATLLYFPCKAVYALGGGIVGGFAYLLSGGSEQTAKSIWIPSMYGTYFITPEHLTGERPVRFVGVAADTDGGISAPATMDQSGSQPVQ